MIAGKAPRQLFEFQAKLHFMQNMISTLEKKTDSGKKHGLL
jgi:hypothetical protein